MIVIDVFARLLAVARTAEERRERDERGATMIEYAILVALISIVAIAIIVAIGPKINSAFQKVNANMPA